MKPLLPILLALLIAGCGGNDDTLTDGGGTGTSPNEAAPTVEHEEGDRGHDLFASSCSSCHTLAAAGAEGQVGPNLDDLAPDADTVLQAIEEGPGSMPNDLVTGEDAQAVADFVAENAGG